MVLSFQVLSLDEALDSLLDERGTGQKPCSDLPGHLSDKIVVLEGLASLQSQMLLYS